MTELDWTWWRRFSKNSLPARNLRTSVGGRELKQVPNPPQKISKIMGTNVVSGVLRILSSRIKVGVWHKMRCSRKSFLIGTKWFWNSVRVQYAMYSCAFDWFFLFEFCFSIRWQLCSGRCSSEIMPTLPCEQIPNLPFQGLAFSI